MTMSATSIKTLKKKIGIVYLVGMAARLLISAIAIAPIANGHITMLLPPAKTAKTVIGVSMQPWIARIAASHARRYCSWPVHHLKKRVEKEIFKPGDKKV